MSNILNQKDFVGAGLKMLDATAIEQHPPEIQWGLLYKNKMSQEERLRYLERVAAAMNHAAAKIQGERDELGRLCEKKEKQLIAMAHAVEQNNAMLQSEVQRMNEDRQQMLAEVARMRAEIRSLRQ